MRYGFMMRFVFVLLVLTLSLFARYDASPTQSCPAFNNLKHTQNTHNVLLDTAQSYTILQKHKEGQYLVLVKGENPAQRWVDAECFGKSKEASKPKEQIKAPKTLEGYIDDVSPVQEVQPKEAILALSWHNAFCERHRYKKECKRSLFSFGKGKYSEKHFVLHGLWPQPQSNAYCNVSQEQIGKDKRKQWQDINLPPIEKETMQRLEKVMPGAASGLHKHEWIKHGTCYGEDATGYFQDAAELTEQFNNSKVGLFFAEQIGKRVTLQQVRFAFDRAFGQGSGKRVELRCDKGMITELWLHLGSGSDDLGTLLAQGTPIRSRCLEGLVDSAGY